MRKSLTLWGIGLAMLAVLTGCVTPVSSGGDARRETMMESGFDVSPGGFLRVEVPDADLDLQTGSGDRVEIEVLAGGSDMQVKALTSYGEKIGLAFQISDDILDIEGDSKTMGKQAGADVQKGKATYPAVAGLAESREFELKLVEEAIEDLGIFNQAADPLRVIARYIIERKK